MNNGVKPTRIEVFKKTHIRANKQPVNEIAGEVMVNSYSLKIYRYFLSITIFFRKLLITLPFFQKETNG